MRAYQIMTQNVVTITEDAAIADAGRLMTTHNISGLPVVNSEGHLIGVISETDFQRRAE